MNWRILKKISIAVIDVFKAFNHKSEPRLIMTLLVKDEEEMLEKNLIFHKSLGVDGFIVTDNNSSVLRLGFSRNIRIKVGYWK